MNTPKILSWCCAACWLLPAAAQEASYLDTAQGWGAYTMTGHELPGSLKLGLRPERQHSRRHPGVPTPDDLRDQNRHAPDGDCWFPRTAPKLMPYLDSVFVPGNTCAEPCDVVSCDPISTSAQRVKSALSEIGLQYSMVISYNAARTAPSVSGQKCCFSSFNNNVLSKWYLLRDRQHKHGLFLSCEADWGRGVNYNENRDSAQDAIGSLSAPQGCLRGGNGVFVPELALGATLCEGHYVLMAGTIDASNYLDQNAYSADWNGNLINRSFNYNPCLPLEWSNWGYLTAWQPCKSFYMMACSTGTNAPLNHNSLRYINAGYWAHNAEIGYINPNVFGWGAGTYRLQYTATRDNHNSGYGGAFNIQQQLGHSSQLGFFTRCGYNDSDAAAVSGCRTAVTGGLVLEAPFRSRGWGSRANNDQVALGFLWQRAPRGGETRLYGAETGLELSAVAQLTPTLFLQPDVQWIHHPVYSTGRSEAWVLQVQAVWRF